MSLPDALIDANGNITVPAHQLAAAMQLWAEGLVTRGQAISGGRIPSHAEADIDSIASVYGGKGTAVAKLAYLSRLERVAVLLQDGIITAAQFRTFMELG